MIENVYTVTEKLYIHWICDKMKSDVRLIIIRMILMLFLVMNIFSWMAVSVSLCVVTAGICIYCLFLHWIVAGHLNYRRLSRRNYGADWTRRTCFEEEIIRIIDGRTSIYFHYNEIVGIREKGNEIRLIFSNGMNVWIYQNCFVNFGWEACKEHIRQARMREGVPGECVLTARAKRQEDKQGRVLRVILAALVVVIICLEAINWAQGHKAGDNRETGGGNTVENVELFARQSLEKLKVLGIEVPDEEKAVNGVMGMPEDMLANMEERWVVGLLLDGIGTNSTMYCFDTEIFDISVMYTDFLNAVAALSGGDLEITNIQEDISGIDEESGAGVHRVSFQCNGTEYEYEGTAYYDWFDIEILPFMNQIIEEQGTGKFLYVTSDGYQNCIVFYNTEGWAKLFNKNFPELELEKPR